jgi:PhnB protein
MISYEDGIRALQWLARAFGFRENARLTTPDGRLSHGEMRAGDGLIMLATPTPDYRGPKRHRESCEQARRWSAVPWIVDGVLVVVPRLKRHFARAKAAGTTNLSEIEEGRLADDIERRISKAIAGSSSSRNGRGPKLANVRMEPTWPESRCRAAHPAR